MRGLSEALDRRLRRNIEAPVAVALSGGGDSLALLLGAAEWAVGAGRRLLVLTVDHGLNPDSGRWTDACAGVAARIGADFQALSWTGHKPVTGLPAAARQARHRLLAGAARAAGARVILLGHTADDLTEAARMRAAGSTTPSPREWSPSPVWPEGRGVFLLRPLLQAGRAELRDWLTARGAPWIDDPANLDLRYARARARQQDGAGVERQTQPDPDFARSVVEDAGGLRLPRGRVTRGGLSAALLCAAGTDRPPRGDRLDRLVEALHGSSPVRATLAGAAVIADADTVRILREPGRGDLPQASADTPVVWDGRYQVHAPGWTVRALAGLAARLSDADGAALRLLHPAARPVSPALVNAAGAVRLPQPQEARPLAHARLLAACGAVTAEPA